MCWIEPHFQDRPLIHPCRWRGLIDRRRLFESPELGKTNPGLRREMNLLCCPDSAAGHRWTRKTVTKTSWNCSDAKTQSQGSNWRLSWKQTVSTADYCYWMSWKQTVSTADYCYWMSWKQTVSTADCCYWMNWKQTVSTAYWRMNSGYSTDKPEDPNQYPRAKPTWVVSEMSLY